MLYYILGLFKYLFRRNVSKLALVHNQSVLDKFSRIKLGTKIFISSVEAYSYVSRGSSLYYTKVGKFTSIGMDCKIGLPSHTLTMLSTSPIFTENRNATGHTWVKSDIVVPYKQTIIGNDVWIGDNVLIMGGVTIGDGAVIGAGSIVTKDLPAYSIAVGIPAKVIKYRFDLEKRKQLEDFCWWNAPISLIR